MHHINTFLNSITRPGHIIYSNRFFIANTRVERQKSQFHTNEEGDAKS